jgi:hypothetical protein
VQFHAVRFYRDDASLCAWVSRMVVRGLAENQPAIIVATPAHSARIIATLSQGLDVAALQREGALTLRDAEEMLSTFMVDGLPDWDLWRRTAIPLFNKLSGPERRTVRAYGEMVDVLVQRGLVEAALRLEDCWNYLARAYPMSLMCAYAADHVLDDEDIHKICWRHTHASADWLIHS